MEKSDLLTVSQFAAAVGQSRQNIYKELSKVESKLTTYLHIIDNRKYIEISAVKLYEKRETVNCSDNQSVNGDKNTTEKRQNGDNLLTGENDERILFLERELEEKNKQIETLHKLLDQQQQLSLHLQAKIDRLALAEPAGGTEEPARVSEQQEKYEKTKQSRIFRFFRRK